MNTQHLIRLASFALWIGSSLVLSSETIHRQIEGAEILLHDLQLGTANENVPSIAIGPAPPIGQSQLINYQTAVHHFSQSGLEAKNFGWVTNNVVVVSRKTQSITPSELLEHLSLALTEALPNLEGTLNLNYLRTPSSIVVPAQPFEVVLPRHPLNGIRSRFILPFKIQIAAETIFSGNAALEASVEKEILLASRRINRGEPLSESDFYVASRDLLRVNGQPLDSNEPLIGIESKSTILKDQPLLRRHVTRIPVVARGDVVDGHHIKGTISITLKVQVLDKGAPGDVVRVRNPKSKKQLKGIVQDDSTIRLL